jgi:hypothetical protein
MESLAGECQMVGKDFGRHTVLTIYEVKIDLFLET